MKKLFLITLAIMIILCGCSSPVQEPSVDPSPSAAPSQTVGQSQEPSSQQPQPESSAPASEPKQSSGIDVQQNLFTVDVTLPASMVGDSSTFDPAAYCAKNGFEKAVVNEDDSITVTMTKSKHDELMREMKASVDETIDKVMTDADTKDLFKKIVCNADCTEITAHVVGDSAAMNHRMALMNVQFNCLFYQSFNGAENTKVTVILMNSDGSKVLDEYAYPKE